MGGVERDQGKVKGTSHVLRGYPPAVHASQMLAVVPGAGKKGRCEVKQWEPDPQAPGSASGRKGLLGLLAEPLRVETKVSFQLAKAVGLRVARTELDWCPLDTPTPARSVGE